MNLRSVPPASFESPESLTAFIQHFEDSPPSRNLCRLAFPIMAGVFLPRVAYDLGAREEIAEHRANEGLIYVLPDHIEGADIPVHTGAVRRSRVLHDILENLDIESKPANLSSTTLLRAAVAILLRELGADGIVRGDDLDNKHFGAPPHLRDELMALAMDLQVPISVKNIDAGRNHATYWPGHRRGKKGTELKRLEPGDVKEGVLQNLERVAEPDRIRLLFVGTNYDNALFGMLGANVALSSLYSIPKTRDEKRQLISRETQKCVDVAAWMSQNVPRGPLVGLLERIVDDPAILSAGSRGLTLREGLASGLGVSIGHMLGRRLLGPQAGVQA